MPRSLEYLRAPAPVVVAEVSESAAHGKVLGSGSGLGK